MEKSTLILIFTIIIIFIVFTIIKRSMDKQLATRECNKKYTEKPGLKACPSTCRHIKLNNDCNDDGECKLTYSCVNRSLLRKLYSDN